MDLEKINKKFRTFGEKIIKYRWLILILFFFVLIFSLFGLSGLEKDSSNDAWYFDDDPLMIRENKFEQMFGSTDIVAVHVSVDNVFSQKNLTQIRELSNELEKKVPFVSSIVSITDFEYIKGTESGIEVGDLIPKVIPSSESSLLDLKNEALNKKSIINRLISADSRETWIVVNLKDTPDDWRQNKDYLNYLQNEAKNYPELYQNFDLDSGPVAPDYLIGKISNQLIRQQKYARINPRATGMPSVSVDKREFFAAETPRLMGIGLLISIILLSFFLRSWRGVVFPLLTAVSAMIITLGIEGYFNVTVQPSILPMPLFLGLAVAVGYSIHLFNFFRKEMLKNGLRRKAVIIALEKTGWPLLFTALTTVFALMSFFLIKIKTLNWVGYTTASIVAITYLLVIVIFPIFLSFGKDKKNIDRLRTAENDRLEIWLSNFGSWVLDHPYLIIIIFIIITVISGYGLTQTEVDFDIGRTMGRRVPYVDRILSVGESEIGSLYNYEIEIVLPEANMAKNPQFLQSLEQFVKEIEKFPLTKRTTSLLNTLKELNQVLNAGDEKYYKIPDTAPMIAQTLLLYENAGGKEMDKWVDYNYQKLRIRVEVSDYNQQELADELKRLEYLRKEHLPEAQMLISGSIARFTDIMYKVSIGQVKAFLIALTIIAVLMMIVFGSVKVGLIGLIPNILPALVVGGVMGLFSIPFDMMTSIIIPMLMGLAVDDTIHFINHAEYEYQQQGNYRKAIKTTFRTVGKSLFMTSLVLILNFAAYLTSIVNFYLHFGILAGLGILIALLADYFVTPICLNITKPFSKK